MTLKEHIDAIHDNLEKDMYRGEASVSDNIVRRLVHGGLQWPEYEPGIVVREFSLKGGKVDFALCHPPSNPLIFIEVKPVGQADGAEEQIFRYAYHGSVDIIVLTDGRRWDFFYPKAPGDYEARLVCTLDITKDDSKSSADRIRRYLEYESVQDGSAVTAIREDHQKIEQQREVKKRIPEAWEKLLKDENGLLLELVAEEVEGLCKLKPANEQVLDYLKSLKRKTVPVLPQTSSDHLNHSSDAQYQTRNQRKKTIKSPDILRVTMPDGQVIEHKNAVDTWLEVIQRLGLHKVMVADGRDRIVSRDKNFRGGRPVEKIGDYYCCKDYGTKRKKKLLDEIAATLGIPVRVEIIPKT